jgi:predicted AlkP superfamily pyrophosphatase or phosphodiesterase
MRDRSLPIMVFRLLLGLMLTSTASLAVAGEPAKAKSKLAVLVVFDQMRGDYLTRWDTLFADDGFHRLEKEGAWFQNCHYPYANTVTGAGHASLLTGCSPMTHGIVSNEWFDRTSGEEVYCATMPRYERVPPLLESNGEPLKTKAAGSPERLLAPTLADALKSGTDGKGRVVALSLKDRSCVLPAGRKADACYWFDSSTGTFITSTYYRDQVHPWVRDFNLSKPANRWFDHEWTRLRADLDYERFSGPDDQPGEGKGVLQGRTFPHSMRARLKRPGKLSYDALYNSPVGNDLLLDLVKRAIDAEEPGKHETPDLLSVSFSSNDPIGHCWGPDSQEVLDVTLRSDLIVKELLAALDAKVGKGCYTLVLTADHGVCPLPEVIRKQGKESDRILPSELRRDMSAFLDATYDEGRGRLTWIDSLTYPWVYLNLRTLQRLNLKQEDVEAKLAEWLKKQTGIQTAYPRSELLKGVPQDDAIGQAVYRSFHPDRSGDVTIVVKPYYQVTPFLTGTGHGTPHSYDTHVPLLVFGPDIRPGARKDKVVPQTVAAVLAQAIGIKPPAAAEYAVPAGLFK